jgi:hypothetical protein
MWKCPTCGESLEDQFDSCWKCAKASATEGVGRVATPRCGAFALACLSVAQIAAFLGCLAWWIMPLYFLAEQNGQAAVLSLFVLLFGFPVSYGHVVALGLAIRYAQGQE